MSLSRRCSPSFGPAVRHKGAALYRAGTVILGECSQFSAEGWVEGSSGRQYRVVLDWFSWQEKVLRASCECFYFQHVSYCKHLWAFVLEVEDREIHRIAGDYRDRQPWRLQKLESGLVEAEPEERADSLRFQWRRQLDSVRPLGLPQVPAVEHEASELYLVLDPDKGFSNGGLDLQFFRRDRLQSGDMGKLKATRLGHGDHLTFRRQDQDLLQLLLGLALNPNQRPTDMYRYRYHQIDPWRDKQSKVWLMPLLFPELLPKLCGRGIFGCLSDDKSQVIPFTLEQEPYTWVFESRDEGDQLWIEGGFVRRSEPGVMLTLAENQVRVLGSGWIFFDHQIAPLEEAQKVLPWIEMVAKDGPLRIDHRDEKQALERLWQEDSLPELRLPERLSLPQQVGQPVPRIIFRFEPRQMLGTVSFLYGQKTLTPDAPLHRWPEDDRIVLRNLQAEKEILWRLHDLAAEVEEAFLLGQGDWLSVSSRDFGTMVRSLVANGWEVQAEGQPIRTASASGTRVTGKMDWFELQVQLEFEGHQVPFPTLLAAAQRQERLVQLGDGSIGLLPEDWLDRFGPLMEIIDAESLTDDQGSLRFDKSQGVLLDALIQRADQEAQVDETFERLRGSLRGFEGIEAMAAPDHFKGQLRPYQELGLAWMVWLTDLGLGGCLADDMGLGKTVQVLAFLEHRRQKGALDNNWGLLVVPRSLLHNWYAEAERFTPGLAMHIHHGPGRIKALKALIKEGKPRVLITTYGTLRRDLKPLQDLALDTLVLDEAQAIKNGKSQTAKACRAIRCRRRLALSGTPVENHLDELWSLFEFLNPGMLGRLPSLSGAAGKLRLSPGALEAVAQAIRPLVLRRTKEQVLTDLPAKTEQTLSCELSDKERKRYNELLRHYRAQLGQKMATVGLKRSKMQVLEALLRLRQAACHGALIDASLAGESSTKLDLLVDRLREVVDEGHKALVFSQFTKLLALVRQRLDAEDWRYEYLDGRTRRREERVESFQTDPDCPLFLISLKAGGVGLNLTAASYIFLLDPWWNPAVEAQAIDRAHRIGQDKPVFAYRLIAKDTIEEKIIQLQESKRALADAIVGQDRRLLGNLSADDLALLLGGPLV